MNIPKYLIPYLTVLLSIAIFQCSKKTKNPVEPETVIPRIGQWEGTGEENFSISFRIIQPDSISPITLSVTGHAVGSQCSYNYTTTSTIGGRDEIYISGTEFGAGSFGPQFWYVMGEFTSPTKGKGLYSYRYYDSYCDASIEHSGTFTVLFKD